MYGGIWNRDFSLEVNSPDVKPNVANIYSTLGAFSTETVVPDTSNARYIGEGASTSSAPQITESQVVESNTSESDCEPLSPLPKQKRKRVSKPKSSGRSNRFQTYMSSLFDNPEFSDIIVKAKGKQFNAHKIILCAGSAVMETKLKSAETGFRIRERNETIELDLSECESDIVQEALRFMYTGNPPKSMTSGNAGALYNFASRLQMEDLKEVCVTYLKSRLNRNIAMDVLLLAEEHNDKGFKDFVLKYIKEHPKCVSNHEKCAEVAKVKPGLFKDILAAQARKTIKK